MANGRSPHIVAMLYALAPVDIGATVFGQYGIVVLQCSPNDFPIDEVGAVQNLQTGETCETG